MGIARTPQAVIYFAGILLKDESFMEGLADELTSLLGPVAEMTPLMPFTQTDYYEKELGKSPVRAFVLFAPLRDRNELPRIKAASNLIEDSRTINGLRPVNIDPGYIALEHVILATTKGYSHRVYLGEGIYADLTLMYLNGTYKALDWTYPDYRETQTIHLLNEWRERLKKELKCRRA